MGLPGRVESGTPRSLVVTGRSVCLVRALAGALLGIFIFPASLGTGKTTKLQTTACPAWSEENEVPLFLPIARRSHPPFSSSLIYSLSREKQRLPRQYNPLPFRPRPFFFFVLLRLPPPPPLFASTLVHP